MENSIELDNKKTKVPNLKDAIDGMNEMMTFNDSSKILLNKIKDATSSVALLQIKTEVTLTEDSYENGELDEVENYELDSKLFIIPYDSSIDVEIFKKFKKYVDEDLDLIFDEETFVDSVKDCDGEEECFYYSGLTTRDGVFASLEEIKDWEKGDFELYSKSCSIQVFINGNEIKNSLLSEIVQSGKEKYMLELNAKVTNEDNVDVKDKNTSSKISKNR